MENDEITTVWVMDLDRLGRVEMMIKRPYTKQAAHLICKNPSCPQKSTRLSIVEERLIQALGAWLNDYKLSIEEVAAAMTSVRLNSLANEQMLRAVDEELDQLHKQRDNLHTILERGVYDDQTYLARNQKLKNEVELCVSTTAGSITEGFQNSFDSKVRHH